MKTAEKLLLLAALYLDDRPQARTALIKAIGILSGMIIGLSAYLILNALLRAIF